MRRIRIPRNLGLAAFLALVLASPAGAAPTSALAAFQLEHGSEWSLSRDPATGRPRRLAGGAIPWFSPGELPRDPSLAGDLLVLRALDFVARHADLLELDPAVLRPAEPPAVLAERGRLAVVHLEIAPRGVPVEGGRVIVAVSHGRLTYVHAVGTVPVAASAVPRVGVATAWDVALTATGLPRARAISRSGAELRFLPADRSFSAHRLVWRLVLNDASAPVRWLVHVDAVSGELVSATDETVSACDPRPPAGSDRRVLGGVRPRGATDAERVELLPFASVGGATADASGFFLPPPPPHAGRLEGPAVIVACTDCVSPPAPLAPAGMDGDVDFGTGGVDEVGNGRATPADRTSYFHAAGVARQAARWLDVDFLGRPLPVRTNFPSGCNAYWDGEGLTFFRSSATCANTGEILGVIAHEWGHGLDDNDGLPSFPLGVDAATGEAVADLVAMVRQRSACMGASFFADPADWPSPACSGVRDLDERAPGGRGVLTTDNAAAECPPSGHYRGVLGREGHCEGEILGQAAWHLVQDLLSGSSYSDGSPLPVGPLPEDAAWEVVERLFYASRPLMASYAPSHLQGLGPSAHDAFLVADDDGTGLADGTPHAAAIEEALGHHGLLELGPATPTSAPCVPPGDPVVTLTTVTDAASGLPAVELAWADVGAAAHHVLRAADGGEGYLPLGPPLPAGATRFVDRGVLPGRTYAYRVVAEGPGGCLSPGADPAVGAVGALLRVDALALDDVLGDGDGVLEVGEEADVFIDLRNDGSAPANRTMVTLASPDAGLVVLDPGPFNYGVVPALGTTPAPRAFRVRADDGVARFVTLVVEAEADEGCFRAEHVLETGVVDIELDTYAVDDTGGGDGDGTWQPGESVDLLVNLRNDGLSEALDVAGSLRFRDGPVEGVTISVAAAAWPDLPGRSAPAPAAFPFVLVADDTLRTRTKVPLLLDVSVGGAFHAAFELSATVGGFPPGCLEWEEDDCDLPNAIVLHLTDDDGDGEITKCDVPDIVHSSRDGLVARSGDTGELLWLVPDACGGLWAFGAFSGGDLDGDGSNEIVVAGLSDHVCAYRSDGSLMWQTEETLQTRAPQVFDLEGDGTVEVVAFPAVLRGTDGAELWRLTPRSTLTRRVIVVDLDLDGAQEIITPDGAFRADGRPWPDEDESPTWFPYGGRGSGLACVANLDADPFPEIVVDAGGSEQARSHDNQEIWRIDLPGSRRGQGPFCAGDVDGDGFAEIGIQTDFTFHLVEEDGTIGWTADMDDNSGAAGCAVFDFEADGFPEIVLQDQWGLHVLDGRDGETLWKTPHWSGTAYEHPVIADVDGDGAAEIVSATNLSLQVYGNPLWAPARGIWNQEAYSVSHVQESGAMTAGARPGFQDPNLFRGQVAGDPCVVPTWGIDVAHPDCGAMTACFHPRLPPRMDVVDVSWDFGDGSPISTEWAPCHVYPGPGDFAVQMTATYGTGCLVVAETTVSLRESPVVEIAGLVRCGWLPCFTAAVVGGLPPHDVVWDWGDGTPRDEGVVACHAFPAGTFDVTAFVRDANDCLVEASRTVTIDDPVILPEVSPPGAADPLLVRRDAERLILSFEDSGFPAGVQLGEIPALRDRGYTHGATTACAITGTTAEIDLPTGDAYLLVAASGCEPAVDGPYGRSSSGRPRPTSEDLGRPRCP